MEKDYKKYVKTEELKNEREFRHLSYRDMSKLMGFKSPATYYNIENGLVEPKISHINKISKILKKPCTNFFNFKAAFSIFIIVSKYSF